MQESPSLKKVTGKNTLFFLLETFSCVFMGSSGNIESCGNEIPSPSTSQKRCFCSKFHSMIPIQPWPLSSPRMFFKEGCSTILAEYEETESNDKCKGILHSHSTIPGFRKFLAQPALFSLLSLSPVARAVIVVPLFCALFQAVILPEVLPPYSTYKNTYIVCRDSVPPPTHSL
jgi:hypothetical protein